MAFQITGLGECIQEAAKSMNRVHPTALIGPHVRLGSGNIVGPYAVIGGRVSLGDDNWIGAGAKLGCPPEVRSVAHEADWVSSADGQGVEIGRGNVIREDVQVHAGWQRPTTLGNGLFLMNQAYVAHDCVLSDGVTLAAGVALAGHVRIGRGANLGLHSTVHQSRVIGALAMIGMSSAVTRDVPPYAKAYGNPARVAGLNAIGMERSGISAETIARLGTLTGLPAFFDAGDEIDELREDMRWFREAAQ